MVSNSGAILDSLTQLKYVRQQNSNLLEQNTQLRNQNRIITDQALRTGHLWELVAKDYKIRERNGVITLKRKGGFGRIMRHAGFLTAGLIIGTLK